MTDPPAAASSDPGPTHEALPERGRIRRLQSLASSQPVLQAIVTNAVSLASTTIVTSALGLAYWFLAARSFSPTAVGFASAAVSGMTLVATLSSLGLGTFALGEAQRDAARTRALVTTVLVASAVAAAVLGSAYVLLVPLLSEDLRPLVSSPWSVLLFVISGVATAVGMVLDQSLVGALKGTVQLARNILFGVLKLLLLVVAGLVLVDSGGLILFGTWVVSAVLSLGALAIVRRRWTRAFLGELRPSAVALFLRDVAGSVLRHQMLNVGLKVPLLALPVLVITVLSAQANANFYIAWQLTNTAFVLPGSLAAMLYAVGADNQDALAQRLRLTLGLSTALTLAAGAILAAGAQPILSIFGPQYARNGTATLIVLALAGIPVMIKNHYVTISRVTRRLRAAVPLVYLGAVLEMLVSYLGGRHAGLVGFASGWLLALMVEACLMLPFVTRALRGKAPMVTP